LIGRFTNEIALLYLPRRAGIGPLTYVARWYILIPKILILSVFWRALEYKMLAYLFYVWLFGNISWKLGIFYGHLVNFVVIW
jgi:hypothetical protein